MKRLLSILAISVAAIAGAHAQTAADSIVSARPTIADHINASGVASVNQPAKLNARLAFAGNADKSESESATTSTKTHSVGGYRIQLFSGNNARTAKNEAASRASLIDSQFPEYATYVNYEAPYWRLKVGDFRSYEEASAALSRLKSAMPSYSREMRVVRDRINTKE